MVDFIPWIKFKSDYDKGSKIERMDRKFFNLTAYY